MMISQFLLCFYSRALIRMVDIDRVMSCHALLGVLMFVL